MAEVEIIEIELEAGGGRLDRALADALPQLSRARIQALMAQGSVTREAVAMSDASARAEPGLYRLAIPPAAAKERSPLRS